MIRRDFMAGLLAACTAPAIVRAESIMVVRRPLISVERARIFNLGGWKAHGYITASEMKIGVDPLLRLGDRWKVVFDRDAWMWRVSTAMYPTDDASKQVWVRVPQLDRSQPQMQGWR